VNLDVHFLPLPYHTWSYVLVRSIVAVNVTSTTFAQQFLSNLYAGDMAQFTNEALADSGQTEVVEKIANYVNQKFGIATSVFYANYNAANSDNLGRIEFKFATGRTVNGTPCVYLNGQESDLDGDSPLSQWYAEIDALLN
jgi:hypothetical protein